jgi:hypothetical protein
MAGLVERGLLSTGLAAALAGVCESWPRRS